MNYNNKKFKPVFNSSNGIVSDEMIFHYKQSGNILTCDYEGKNIIKGHLLGLVREEGIISLSYHQINNKGDIMTGICTSIPEIMEDGKTRLHETWQWTSGDKSEGKTILEEV